MSFSRGRADYLELGDWNAVCYQCGRKFKASTMLRHWQGYYVCQAHWEPRQPQDFVRSVPDKQTPPWAQPMPGNAYAKDFINISTSDLTAGDYTVSYSSGDGPAGGGAVTVIITIQQGVTIGTLTLAAGWPAGTTIVINNYGTIGTVTNNSGITPTVNNWGLYPGVPWQIVFTTQPTDVATNTAISPAVVVAVQDYLGNTVTSWPNSIVITLSLGANPGDAALAGTLAIETTSGVATFSTLELDQGGVGYTLVAQGSDGLTGTDLFFPTISNAFEVTSGYTLVAAELIAGDSYGYNAGSGSLTPQTFNGQNIDWLQSEDLLTPGSETLSIKLSGLLAQAFFTTLTVDGLTLTTASALWTQSAGKTRWLWSVVGITTTGTYPVTIT